MLYGFTSLTFTSVKDQNQSSAFEEQGTLQVHDPQSKASQEHFTTRTG
jgi:hypothetical protein